MADEFVVALCVVYLTLAVYFHADLLKVAGVRLLVSRWDLIALGVVLNNVVIVPCLLINVVLLIGNILRIWSL